ncbi:MAG: hypothetical protein V1702_03620 [Candidatus Woesearchaeota archaeon]
MKKALAIALAVVLIVNFVLLAVVKGYSAYFWLVLGVIAVLAYTVIPKIR